MHPTCVSELSCLSGWIRIWGESRIRNWSNWKAIRHAVYRLRQSAVIFGGLPWSGSACGCLWSIEEDCGCVQLCGGLLWLQMLLRVAMSSTKNVLGFGLNFLPKTCLWGLIKMSLFGVIFLYQFWIKIASIWPWTPKIHKNVSLPLTQGTRYRPKTDFYCFWILQDASNASPRRLKTPPDGSKTVSRRFHDGS